MSVEHTSRTGADKGYFMVVPEDGCSTMNADWHNASINYALQNVVDRDDRRRGDRGPRLVKSRAAVFHEAGRPFEVTEIELDEPRAGEVLVRMAAIGICGTDLHMVKGEWQRPTPMVLGHEGAGIVEAVGDGVDGVGVGDSVVLSWAPSCGECADCRRGRPAACLPLQYAIGGGTLIDGGTGMSLRERRCTAGTATGALSERLVVSQQVALPLGDGVPLEEAALLGCAALTGVGAVLFAAGVEEGASVLVIGAGGVGQFVVQGRASPVRARSSAATRFRSGSSWRRASARRSSCSQTS